MSARTYYSSFIQDYDLVSVFYCGYSLGNDQDCAIPCLIFQFPAQSGIGFKIQGREAVIKNIDGRFLYQGSGYCQALFLAPGYICSSLGDIRVQTFLG